MGTYWKAICDRKEFIDPGRIGTTGRKLDQVVSGPAAGVILAYMSAYDGWLGAGVRLVDDTGLYAWEYEQASEEYEDVTAKAVAFYNERFEIKPPIEVAR